MREDALPDEAGEAAAENAGGDEQRRASGRGADRGVDSVNVFVWRRAGRACRSHFFIRYALMNTSMSPSSTRLTSPTCSFVR